MHFYMCVDVCLFFVNFQITLPKEHPILTGSLIVYNGCL